MTADSFSYRMNVLNATLGSSLTGKTELPCLIDGRDPRRHVRVHSRVVPCAEATDLLAAEVASLEGDPVEQAIDPAGAVSLERRSIRKLAWGSSSERLCSECFTERGYRAHLRALYAAEDPHWNQAAVMLEAGSLCMHLRSASRRIERAGTKTVAQARAAGKRVLASAEKFSAKRIGGSPEIDLPDIADALREFSSRMGALAQLLGDGDPEGVANQVRAASGFWSRREIRLDESMAFLAMGREPWMPKDALTRTIRATYALATPSTRAFLLWGPRYVIDYFNGQVGLSDGSYRVTAPAPARREEAEVVAQLWSPDEDVPLCDLYEAIDAARAMFEPVAS